MPSRRLSDDFHFIESSLLVMLYALHMFFFLQMTCFKVCLLICPISGSPIKAVLSVTNGLSCSCPRCKGEYSYHYYKQDDQTWKFMESTKYSMKPQESGTYACRAVMTTMRSFLSNTHSCEFLLWFLQMDFDIVSP